MKSIPRARTSRTNQRSTTQSKKKRTTAKKPQNAKSTTSATRRNSRNMSTTTTTNAFTHKKMMNKSMITPTPAVFSRAFTTQQSTTQSNPTSWYSSSSTSSSSSSSSSRGAGRGEFKQRIYKTSYVSTPNGTHFNVLSGSGDNTHPLTFHFKAGTIDNDGKERIEKEVTSQDYKTIHDAMMMSGSALEEGERKQQSLLGHKDDKDHKGRGQHDDKQQQQKMSQQQDHKGQHDQKQQQQQQSRSPSAATTASQSAAQATPTTSPEQGRAMTDMAKKTSDTSTAMTTKRDDTNNIGGMSEYRSPIDHILSLSTEMDKLMDKQLSAFSRIEREFFGSRKF